jgi:hypothetical protein
MTTGGNAGRGRRVLGLAIGMFTLVLVGTVLQQLSTGTPPTVWHWLLLVVGGCLLAVAATLPRWTWRKPDWVKVRWRRALAWLSIAVVVVVAGGVLVVFVRDPYGPVMVELRGCPRPVELRVATSPESLAPFQEVADAYERWTAADHRGCQTVNLFVYAVPFDGGGAGLLASLPGGWPDEQALIRWPRPDVWLADAGFEVAQVRSEVSGELVRLAGQRDIGWTPVVVGIPPVAAEWLSERRTELSWLLVLGMTVEEREQRFELVRPDPDASVVGKAAITPIYANAELDHGEIERRIALALDRGAYPQGDELALLCRHRQREDHAERATAVVVSEQALVRFNQGHSPGAECVPPSATGGMAAGDPITDDIVAQSWLTAVYPTDTVVLRRQFVRLDWTDSASPQDQAAEEFGVWLDSADGGRVLQRIGLRSDHVPLGDPIGEESGALAFGTWDEPDHDVVSKDLLEYRKAYRPARVLVLLDTSGSMAEPVDQASSRFDQAAGAVLGTLDRMTTADEFGLWAFPDQRRGDAVRQLVPVGAGDNADERRQLTQQAIDGIKNNEERELVGGTPLFDALGEALREVGDTTEELATAIVVITDGDDTESRTSAADLVVAVSGEESPRVFVIATGAATCDSDLRAITTTSAGLCRVVTADSLDGALADFVSVLWGRGEGE